MQALWFLALAGMIAFVCGTLFLAGWQRRRPGEVKMVLIGAAAGEQEAILWAEALESAGDRLPARECRGRTAAVRAP